MSTHTHTGRYERKTTTHTKRNKRTVKQKQFSIAARSKNRGLFSLLYLSLPPPTPPLYAFPALSGRVFGCARKEGAHLCETVKISVGNRINFQGSTGAVFAHFFFSGVGGGKGREAFCIAQLMFGRMKIIASATPTGEKGLSRMKVG